MARKGERRSAEGMLIERPRLSRIKLTEEGRKEIADRVIDKFYQKDIQDRSEDTFRRLERYAKFRMWSEGRDDPWPDASDAAIPDMMTHSWRVQDTLHNAVMSARPVVTSKARNDADRDKQERIDNLVDFQVFVEQDGEDVIGSLIDSFVNDGTYFAYVPWVKEKRETSEIRQFPPVPQDMAPIEYFQATLAELYPRASIAPTTNDGWDWRVDDVDETLRVSFFTADSGIEMVTEKDAVVFDGPRLTCVPYRDIFYPVRAANLQTPGPSNPGGATHVILRDYPSKDEINRLKESGYYDLMPDDEDENVESAQKRPVNDEQERQVDVMQGTTEVLRKSAPGHDRLTRLICFDIYDIDDDGRTEDVIWWVIVETRQVVRARRLTEMFPAAPPRRPLVSRALYPVPGRVAGISLLEMMEGLHDLVKETFDMMSDNSDLELSPYFFYRPFSGLKNELIHLLPGRGYPSSDPQRDVYFPPRNANSAPYAFNRIALLTQWTERLDMVGDLQFGRVPQGKASALRTVGGIQMISGQGEARPERLLRRFFSGLVEIWAQIHELDKVFLPEGKVVRAAGLKSPDENPLIKIDSPQDIEGRFDYVFQANAFNTSRMALQQSLQAIGQYYMNPLSFQAGTVKPDGYYRWQRDIGKAFGVDPFQYLSEPTPGAGLQRLFAEEAISLIFMGRVPTGEPAEAGGYQEHYEKLLAFLDSDEFGFLTIDEETGETNRADPRLALFQEYLQRVATRAGDERQALAIAQAAAQAQQGQGGQPGRPPEQAPDQNAQAQPPISGGELLDESLPGAGGGGNA